MSQIGVFMNLPKGDFEAEARIGSLKQGLENLGHTGLQIECRYGANTDAIRRQNAKELIDFAPDVLHVASGSMLDALQQEMQRLPQPIPIVFAGVIDPVGTRRISSLEKPGGNATGFASIFFNIGAKWLGLLKVVVPGLTRAAVIRDPATLAGRGQFDAVEGAAKTLGVTPIPVDVSNANETEQVIAALGKDKDCGLIVTAGSLAGSTRQRILDLALEHRLPAIHPNRMYATNGGLMAYGPITVDLYRSAAGYVDRILKGAKPADLPTQQTGKYELDINLKTAAAIGATVPPALVVFADRVIK